MDLDFPASEFWDYAVELYGAPGVAEACLGLQQRHGVDVNLVLFGVWVGAVGRGPMSAADMRAAAERVAPWHGEVVRHLRHLRKHLKSGIAPAPEGLVAELRRSVAGVEIDAEHIEQLMLEAMAPAALEGGRGQDRRRGNAAANLAAYFSALDVAPASADDEAVAVVLSAAFP